MAPRKVQSPTASVDATSLKNMNNLWQDIPLGFRFCPTDEELVVGFLAKKINNLPLPYDSAIYDVRLYEFTPDDLAAAHDARGQNEWYFFTEREFRGTAKVNGVKRTLTGKGYWKSSGEVKDVFYEGVKVGSRRNLVFDQLEPTEAEAKRTDWLMNEYCIDTSETALCRLHKRNYQKGGDLSAALHGLPPGKSQKKSDNIPDNVDLELRLSHPPVL